MSDPFIALILKTLHEQPHGFSEFDLIKVFESHDLFVEQNNLTDAGLALFQKHFLTMNALYRLQQTLWQEEQILLSISPLNINIEKYDGNTCASNTETLPVEISAVALRDYYLDTREFESTQAEEVQALLQQFWTRFYCADQRLEALERLEIDIDNPTPSVIKQQYKKQAARHHPDKGGSPEAFIAIREAYECLITLQGEAVQTGQI
jgi:hypothetical protein